MWWVIAKAIIAAIIIVTVSEIANRLPRLGALLLSLPVVSLLTFLFTWTKHENMTTITRLARETLILVPLGLPFFIPLALSDRLGLGFWSAFLAGIALASTVIGLWFWLGPKTV